MGGESSGGWGVAGLGAIVMRVVGKREVRVEGKETIHELDIQYRTR